MRITAILLFFVWSGTLFSQDLYSSISTTNKFIWRISAEEAKSIFENGPTTVNEKYFHTLIDTIPIGKDFKNNYNKDLSIGHYLIAGIQKENLVWSYYERSPYDVQVFQNNTDLVVQVTDSLMQPIADAKVVVKKRNLKFDKKSKSYRSRVKFNKENIEVTIDGFRSFHQVKNTNIRSKKEVWRNVLYGKPQRYVVLPIRYIIRLPIDGFKSIRRKGHYGVIYGTKNGFRKFRRLVACTFSSSPCTPKEYKGYAILSKPKYRINDTLKVKAYLTDHKNRPLKIPLEVELGGGIRKSFGMIEPAAPGSYEWTVILDKEKYKLKLDKKYRVNFRKDHLLIKSVGFKLEQYDLKAISFTVDKSRDEHIHTSPFFLKINAKDENELRLKDARVKIKIQTTNVNSFLEKNMFVPIAVLDTNFLLDANEETAFYIPDSLFPKANLKYNVNIELLNGNNESRKQTLEVNRKYKTFPFRMELDQDSIIVTKIDSTNSSLEPASLFFYKDRMEEIGQTNGMSKFKIDPGASFYSLFHEGARQLLYMRKESSQLSLSYTRSKDSIIVNIVNPRKLPFSYFVYKVNREVKKGFGNISRISFPAKNSKNYTFSIEYLWAGMVDNKHYSIPAEYYKVNLIVNQPSRIVPGQQVDVEITAVDQKGKPIEDLDVSAFGSTAKLKHYPEKFKAHQKNKKRKKLRANYQKDVTNYHGKLLIPYSDWAPLTRLDTIAYYNLRFPKDSLYRIEYSISDSITQVAPFVVRNGKIQKVHVVHIDNVPLYFSWATHDRPFSFPCKPGKREIRIRIADAEITLKNVEIFANKKNIIAIDPDEYFNQKAIVEKKHELDKREVKNYERYTFFYSHGFGPKPVWLEQDSLIYALPKTNGIGVVGPIFPRKIKFEYLNEFKHEFWNTSKFRHEFYPNLMKMWEVNEEKRKFNNLQKFSNGAVHPSFRDTVRTVQWIKEKELSYLRGLRNKKYKFSFKANDNGDNGSLNLKPKLHKGAAPVNLFFFSKNDREVFSHLPGYTNRIPKIKKGEYQFYILYNDKSYQKVEIQIQANGSNYRDLEEFEILPPDEYSEKIDSILQHAVVEEADELTESQLRKIYQNLQKGTHQGIEGTEIFGKVTEFGTEDPIIGASVAAYKDGVFVTGTSTDFNGEYRINAGGGFFDLEFSYIGYASKRIKDVYAGFFPIDVEFDEFGSIQLEEVVVAAFKVPLVEQNNTTSSMMITADDISNMPLRNLSGLAGRVAGISISEVGNEIMIRGSRISGTYYYIDGIRVQDTQTINLNEVDDYRIVNGAEAKAVYGVDQVVLIQSKSKANQAFYEASLAASGIRDNFSDEAFWKPTLRTNREGKINFQTRFPDDITKWNLHYIGAKGKYAGYKNATIKSFKPIASILSIPKFIVAGDTTLANTRTLNYTQDSLALSTMFSVEQNGELINATNDSIKFKDSDVSLFPVSSNLTDSLTITYEVKRSDGYLDGEKRELPILPKGLSVAKGFFDVLNSDTSFIYQPTSSNGETTIYIDRSKLNVVRRSLTTIKKYQYLCNEQLASKLLAYLHDKILAEYLGKQFVGEKEILKIIDKLNQRKNEDKLWGWWRNNKTSYWITGHVVKALVKAKSMGYEVDLQTEELVANLIFNLEGSTNIRRMIDAMQTLKKLDSTFNPEKYLAKMDSLDKSSLYNRLRYTELKLSYGQNVDTDWMKEFKKETLFGNVYYQDTTASKWRNDLFRNTIQYSLIAYRILRLMNVEDAQLRKIRQYFFEARQSRSWQNTYEKIAIIETIIPELVKNEGIGNDAVVFVESEVLDTVSNFPSAIYTNDSKPIKIRKEGKAPVYFTAYSNEWVEAPASKKDHFKISTQVINEAPIADEFQLRVDLIVEKQADYVMIEIPIPAGTIYNSKSQRWRHEVHREYYNDRVVIFCRTLLVGDYNFSVDLFTKFEGNYTINPAKVSLMYFPTFYGNNEIKRLNINPEN